MYDAPKPDSTGEAGQGARQPCVVFAANRGYALTNSRSSLIDQFLSSGWAVVLATTDDPDSRSLCEKGAVLAPVSFNRGGFSPWADVIAYRRLVAIYRQWRPALVQHFHAKPVILGSIAARKALGARTRISNVITGLGHAFIAGGATARLAGWGYGRALGRSDITIFQNRDDKALFLARNWVAGRKARLIASSGVDMTRFPVVQRVRRDQSAPTVVMLGRLLRQKGIGEFIEVARHVRRRWPNARFLWAGEEDPVHPDAVSVRWIRRQQEIEYLGLLADVRPLLAEADLLLFPSYREGTPRVILEAGATGMPAVGFDVPGVREAIRNGETGYLVPHPDVQLLADRVIDLLEDATLRMRMGLAARKMVEAEFDIRSIQAQYIEAYRSLGVRI